MRRFYAVLVFLCGCAPAVVAQEAEQYFYGLVTDENNNAVPEVLVTLNWTRSGVLSGENGTFYIAATPADTLTLFHTSFEPKAIILSNFNAIDTLQIALTIRTLELDEVVVNNWGNWSDFKHKIATMNADSIRNTEEYRLETMFGAKKRHPIKNPYHRGWEVPKFTLSNILFRGIIYGNLPNMLYTAFSRDQKKRRKIQKELLQQQAVNKNAYRYSAKILSEMLHIEGDELRQFKLYCDYLLDFSKEDYALAAQINQLYNKWKENGKTIRSQTDSLHDKKLNYLPVSNTPFNSSTEETKR